MAAKPATARFWAKVERAQNGACLDWVGAKQPFGHGVFNIGRRDGTILAHRFSYEQRNGPIPDGACILHSCDRPQCVNTAHLRAGTYQDNADDCSERNRRLLGSQTPQAKLCEEEIPHVLERVKLGASYNSIGKSYGVNHATIRDIAIGKTWKHVPVGEI